ncbi:MAG: hypothetical protein PHI49_06715 [Halothiobacillaceae bacterium]|nr:hypothetical protein [Halothiobacillaceae bacterium]
MNNSSLNNYHSLFGGEGWNIVLTQLQREKSLEKEEVISEAWVLKEEGKLTEPALRAACRARAKLAGTGFDWQQYLLNQSVNSRQEVEKWREVDDATAAWAAAQVRAAREECCARGARKRISRALQLIETQGDLFLQGGVA